jgi:GH24 family phage-related lysozyme (muramidase)
MVRQSVATPSASSRSVICFFRWNMDNGHVVQGLINRRNKEIALWNTPA